MFLDSQLDSTNRRKYQALASQGQQEPSVNSSAKKEPAGSLPLLSDRKPAAESARRLINSISVSSTNKKALIQESLVAKPKKNFVRELPKSVLEKTPLE